MQTALDKKVYNFTWREILNQLERMTPNPLTLAHSIDIIVRTDGVDRRYEGDFLKDIYKDLKRKETENVTN